jgi:hypothetical protein
MDNSYLNLHVLGTLKLESSYTSQWAAPTSQSIGNHVVFECDLSSRL